MVNSSCPRTKVEFVVSCLSCQRDPCHRPDAPRCDKRHRMRDGGDNKPPEQDECRRVHLIMCRVRWLRCARPVEVPAGARCSLAAPRLLPIPFARTDGPFGFVYSAWQWGPFAEQRRPAPGANAPDQNGVGTLMEGRSRDDGAYATLDDGNANRNFVRSWENDGIVNTRCCDAVSPIGRNHAAWRVSLQPRRAQRLHGLVPVHAQDLFGQQGDDVVAGRRVGSR